MKCLGKFRPKPFQISSLVVVLALALTFAVACGGAAPPARKATAPEAPKAPAAAAPAAPVAAATAVPTAVPRPTPAPAAKPKVDRLRMAVSPPVNEVILSWLGTTSDANLQLRHFVEPLIQTDLRTGEMTPGLATSWEMTTPDGKTWTFKLRKGVPFHGGWGQFSAKDVPHTIALNAQQGAIGTDTALFRQLLGETEAEIGQNVQLPDDSTLVFKLKRPRADMDFIATARQGNLLIYSKAQWDAQGKAGYEKPAGTGPFQFVDRQLGQWLLFQRVENHWRKTPEFKEFQLLRVPEAATRLAMSLTGEAQISEVDRELHKEAVAKGMKVVNSQLPAVAFSFIIGGLFNPSMPTYDPTVPALNVKVREAINRAVNRKELIETILAGQASPHITWGYHPSLEGWNPEWEKQFEAKYGYNPARAKALLEEAGYPNGFEITMLMTTLPGAPEMIPAAEATTLYLKAIGLKVKTVEMEFAKLRDLYRASKTHNLIYPIRGTYRPIPVTLQFYNWSGPDGFQRIVPYKEMDDKYKQLVSSVNQAERERLMREIGDIKFNGYTEVPIAWMPGQIVVDPRVVGEYVFPGNINGVFSHIEYVKPAQ